MQINPLKTIKILVALALLNLTIGDTAPLNAAPRSELPNVAFIYDLSNSMWAPLNGAPKVTLAGQGIFQGLKGLNKKVNLAVLSFGHMEKTGCVNNEIISKLDLLNENKIKLALKPLRPRGNAPTSKALLDAAAIAASRTAPYTTILLTDGPSNCPKDPCITAKELKKAHPNLTIDVLVLGTKANKNLARLACIAAPSKGTVTYVTTPQTITAALKESFKRAEQRQTQQQKSPAKVAETKTNNQKTEQAPKADDWMGATEIIVTPPKKEITGAVKDEAEAEKKNPFANMTKTNHGGLALQAHLTETTPAMKKGLTWAIYAAKPDKKTGKHKLISVHKSAEPVMSLPAGTYLISAHCGKAYINRKITIQKGINKTEKFVLNAGGLKIVSVLANGSPVQENTVTFDIFSDERDQFGKRLKVISKVRPGIFVRLNAGIYHLVSTYGDANAQSRADVSVEAGKLTETTMNHEAAKVTFKLVYQSGGEALADTKWSLLSATGNIIKKSAGALPTHFLTAGDYTILAERGEKKYKEHFSVQAGDSKQIEVVIQ